HGAFSGMGVPAPTHSTARAGATGASPSSTPGAGASGSPALLALCQAWDAERQDSKGKSMDPAQRQALTAAAGGKQHITAFCTAMLAPSAANSPSPSPAAPTTTHPSNGNASPHPHPTPTPKH